jgi:cytochrome b561
MTSDTAPAWKSSFGIAAMLLGLLFVATEANEWMSQIVIEINTPPGLELPEADCRVDELEEEGLSLAECAQMVERVEGYAVSRPGWFASVQSALAGLGTIFGILSVLAGALLLNQRSIGRSLGVVSFAALVVIDAGHFVAAQQAGPIIRAMHLPEALLWFSIHLVFVMALLSSKPDRSEDLTMSALPAAYGRFGVVSHWFIAFSVFFLFVSSWWMLALPLPSDEFRFREFPFQLHKNLGITIILLMIVMAIVRLSSGQALADVDTESAGMRRLRLSGHIALYVLVFAVCITGYMSSSYSGWGTTWWWLIDLPYWGYEDEELNQLYSDLHLWACWALLIAMAAHIGAALIHAFRNDGLVRRIVRW